MWKAVLIISSQLYLQSSSIESLLHMREIMYIMCTLFILELRLAARSMLFTLQPPDYGVANLCWHGILSSSLHVLYANMMEM